MTPAGRPRRALAGLVLLLVTAPGPADQTVELDAGEVAVGDQLAVRLTGWPRGPVLVELCGNQAARGSVDCAVQSSVQSHVNADGTGVVLLPVAPPPVACPCAVRVRDLAGVTTATAPITVTGHSAPVAPEPARAGTLTVTGVTVTSGRLP